jgi:hypothetical protein
MLASAFQKVESANGEENLQKGRTGKIKNVVIER